MESDPQEGLVREVAAMRQQLAAQNQRHGFPALLSFFVPGLGQLVKGHIFKGIVIFVGLGVSALAMMAYVGFVTTPILWVWQLYDAYRSPD